MAIVRNQNSIAAFFSCMVFLAGLVPVAAYGQAIPDGEYFDSVTVPALPSDWSSVSIQGSQSAVTSTTQADSSPNSALIPCPSTTSQTALVSKLYTFSTALPNYSLQVHFAHKRGMETNWDGGVLEVSINGVPFIDVKHASIGGTFSSGDYNTAGIFAGPLAGRAGWTGTSASFENVMLTIPSIPDNSTLQFRFMVGTDAVISGPGWYIDDFEVTPQINVGIEVTPLDNEILPGETASFDIAFLNPSSSLASPFFGYLSSPSAALKRFSFSTSGLFQKYGEASAIVQGMMTTPAFGSTVMNVQTQDVPERSGAKLTYTGTSVAEYVGASNALGFLSSSPDIGGGSIEAGMEILAFDPCLPAPDPLPIPLSGKIVISTSVPACAFGAAALALQNLGARAAIFPAPLPVPFPVFGEFPAPFLVEAPTAGLSIPVLTFDIMVFGPMFSGLGTPGTTTARLEGRKSSELRTIAVSFMQLGGDDPIQGNNITTALVNVVTDIDGDGTPDIRDACKSDNNKVAPGACGCGIADTDLNANSVPDCLATPDFKTQVVALQKLLRKLSLGRANFKSIKAQIKGLRASVKSIGVNNAAAISISSAGVDISKLTKAADKALGKALGAGSSATFGPAKQAAVKALGKLLKGIAG